MTVERVDGRVARGMCDDEKSPRGCTMLRRIERKQKAVNDDHERLLEPDVDALNLLHW